MLQQLQGLQRPDSTPRTSKAGHSHTEPIPPAFSSSKKFGFSGYVHAVVTRMWRVQLGDLVPELWNRWDYDLIAKRCYEKHGIDIYEPKASPRCRQCAGNDLAQRGSICHSDATVVALEGNITKSCVYHAKLCVSLWMRVGARAAVSVFHIP